MFKLYVKTVEGWHVEQYLTFQTAKLAMKIMQADDGWLCFVVVSK